MRLTGTLEQVETYKARAFAAADAVSGASVVYVDRVEPLLTELGTVTVDINGDEYTATPTADDVAPYITISPVLAADVDELDPVTVVPAAEVKWATVSFPGGDDQGDPTEYRVPLNMVALAQFADGPKNGDDERVAVEVETDDTTVVGLPNGPTTHDATTTPIIVRTPFGESVRIDGDGITTYTDDPVPVRTKTGLIVSRLAIAADYVFVINGSTGSLRKINMETGDESLTGFPKAGPFLYVASDGINVFAVDAANDIRSYDMITGVEDLTGFPIAGTFSQIAADGGRLFAVDSAADVRSYDAASGVQDTVNFPKVGTYTWLAASDGRLFAVDAALDIHSFDATTGVEDVTNFPIVGSFGQIAADDGVLYAIVGSPIRAFDAITGIEDTDKFPLDVNSQGFALAVGGGYLAVDSGAAQNLRIFNAGPDFPSTRTDSSDGSAKFHDVAVSNLTVAGDLDVSGPAMIPQLQIPSTRYIRSTNQSMVNNTATTVTFSTHTGTDPANSGLTESAGVITVAEAGLYRISGFCRWAANSDSTRRALTLLINGADVQCREAGPALNHASLTTDQNISDEFALNAGDTIAITGTQSIAAGSLNITAAHLSITRIGALAA